MHPIFFDSKYFTIESLWLFISLAFIASGIFLIYLAKTHHLKLNFLLNYGFKIVLISLVLGRIVYVIQNYEVFFVDFSLGQLKYIFYIWDKGISFWGSILGLYIGLKRYCRIGEENLQEWLDVIAISFFLGLSISCIGLFLDGASYGHESDLPWAVNFDNITVRYSVPIHPTQIYAAIYNLILFLVSWRLYVSDKFKNDGDLFLGSVAAFSLLKLIEEFFRGDEAFLLLGIRNTQYLSFFIGLISLFLLLDRYNKVHLDKILKYLPFKKTHHGNS